MIYKKCIMTIAKNGATLDEDIYLYRLDKNVELHFTIVNNKYKFDKSDMNNIISQTNAAYFQIRLYKNADIKYTFAIQPTDAGKAILTITDDLIDDPIEVGEYDFQISLLDEEKTSMISMPIVSKQLHVCEPLVSEDAVMGKAVLGLSKAAKGEIKNAFDSQGNYIREIHNDGEIISAQMFNKFEEALETNTKAIKNGTGGTGTSYDDTVIKADIQTLKDSQINLVTDETSMEGIKDNEYPTLTTTDKTLIGSINEVNAQYKDIASSKLDKNDKIKSSQLSTNTDADKIKLINLSEEVRQAITGNAPVSGVIPNKSITLDKLSFVTTGKNLLNKNTAVQGKCLKYNETTLYDKDDYYVSDFIEIEPSTQYTCNYMYGYAYYDTEKTGVSGHTPPNVGGTNTITTPENVKYIRLDIYKTLISKTQFEKGATATSFEDYYAYIGNQYIQRQPFIVDEVPDKSLSIDKLDFIKYTKNLFDVSKVSEKGWYMNYTNGTPESNQYVTELCYSDYIKVEQGEYIVNETLHSYAYFDKNKKYISGATSFKANTVLTIPVDCKYVVISIYYDNREKYQLQKGNVATPLEPYGYNLDGMIDNVESKNRLSLPEKYELVVGDTFELFYKGIMLCNNPYNYNIKITCEKGSAYSKRYIFTPVADDIGTHKITISIIDDDEKLLAYKSVNLVVKNKASSPTSNKNVLCVGDSLTVNGIWPSELCRRLTGTSGNPIADGLSNIKFIGTCNGTNEAKYEGYGGWNYASYNSAYKLNSYMWITTTHTKTQTDQHSVYKDANGTQWKLETIETGKIKLIRINDSGTLPTTGTLKWVSGGADKSDIVYSASEIAAGNPFWNESSGQVDFSNYATSLGVTSIDYCYVLLGWNQSYATETEYKQSVKTFINNLLRAFPNCKIGLVGLEVPSLDGFGENYGCGWNYYDKLKFVFNVNQWYFDLSQEFTNVDFVNLAGQFDSENNMRTGTRQVNTRNSKTEIYGTNGVHPADEGYLQIADAVYRHITHLL